MKFELIQVKSLPKLAWCALLRSDSETAVVYHGSMVETNEESFFEGTWDGPFEDRQFHHAKTLAGSGGVSTQEGILFASATNLTERLYSIRLDQCLYVSNSHVFLLAQLDDEPDPTIAHYFFDFLESLRRGPASKPQSLTTRQGRNIELHPCCNLLIDENLAVKHCLKPNTQAPKNYADYHQLLESTLERVFVNAAHSGRLHSYTPITTISQGYDSVAVAALASKAGCREAMTFTSLEDARAAGEALSLMTKGYDFMAFQQLPDYPEAEFCALPFGSNTGYRAFESELSGKLLLTGFCGGYLWSLTSNALSNLKYPWKRDLTGNSLNEFRLRAGFLHLPVPLVGIFSARDIYHITHSSELKAWSTGGEYNRPIPRRIAEDAGVPRELFGQSKVAGAHSYPHRSMSEKSRNDFMKYCEENSIHFSNLLPSLPKRILGFLHGRLCTGLQRLPDRMKSLMLSLTYLRFRNYNHPAWRNKYLYTFHWGISKIRDRYVVPEDIKHR